MKAKLYPRICSNCGCRFYSLNKMDARCPTCVENLNVKVDERGNRVVETRGQRCIGSRCGMFIQPDTRRW